MPTIKLYANLRKIAGKKALSIPGANLGEVLSLMIERYPALGEFVLEIGQIRSHLIITINGHNTTDLNVVVTEQDTIAIFPPIAGG